MAPRRNDAKKDDDYTAGNGPACPTPSSLELGGSRPWLPMASPATRLRFRGPLVIAAALLLLVLLLTPLALYVWAPAPAHCELPEYSPPAEAVPLPRYHGPA
ncbi:hypothetical protein TSOC_015079, partial [Tetrabaena socialis]